MADIDKIAVKGTTYDVVDPTVTQTSPTSGTYSYWRPLLVGYTSSSSETSTPSTQTNTAFVFSTLKVQPSTGIVRMGGIHMFKGNNTANITNNSSMASDITLELPSSSGTLALTSDIPSIPTNLGDVDLEDYDYDIYLYVASVLTESGEYILHVADDDYYFYVHTEVEQVADGVLFANHRLWGSEEGPNTAYYIGAIIEDGEVTDYTINQSITAEDIVSNYAPKNHAHWAAKSSALSVWDYCNSNDFIYDTYCYAYMYRDTTADKVYWIEYGVSSWSPSRRFQKVTDLTDGSKYYQRVGVRNGNTWTWDAWQTFTAGAGGFKGIDTSNVLATYSNTANSIVQLSHTATEDCWAVGTGSGTSSYTVQIDGVTVSDNRGTATRFAVPLKTGQTVTSCANGSLSAGDYNKLIIYGVKS